MYLMVLSTGVLYLAVLAAILLLSTAVPIYLVNKVRRWFCRLPAGGRRVAFFHPYCMSGGGGERVLWTAIAAIVERFPQHHVYVYCDCGGAPLPTMCELAERVRGQFGVHVPYRRVQLVPLHSAFLLKPRLYPVMTLVGESLGSMLVAAECLYRLLPDVFIDTMGCAFSMPVVACLAGGCSRLCYVHYPTVSSSMMGRLCLSMSPHVSWRRRIGALVKYIYYAVLCWAYSWAGRWADVVMCNGSWTAGHISALWKRPIRGSDDSVGSKHVADVRVVFPPCDVDPLGDMLAGDEEGRRPVIVSVAQFRPEKDHQLQLYSFCRFITDHPSLSAGATLVLAGSCRDSDDRLRVQQLRQLTQQLQLTDRVKFEVNVTRDRLRQLYSSSLIGLHTMLDEHFGIGVVDMMAAGLIVIGHNSGGPRFDIINVDKNCADVDSVGDSTGFLASSATDFASAMARIISLDKRQRNSLRRRARESVLRFGPNEFRAEFLRACSSVL